VDKSYTDPACAGFCAFVQDRAMFRQLTKQRVGIEKISSDGEKLFVMTP